MLFRSLEAFGQFLKNAVDQFLGAFEDLAGGTFRDGKDVVPENFESVEAMWQLIMRLQED